MNRWIKQIIALPHEKNVLPENNHGIPKEARWSVVQGYVYPDNYRLLHLSTNWWTIITSHLPQPSLYPARQSTIIITIETKPRSTGYPLLKNVYNSANCESVKYYYLLWTRCAVCWYHWESVLFIKYTQRHVSIPSLSVSKLRAGRPGFNSWQRDIARTVSGSHPSLPPTNQLKVKRMGSGADHWLVSSVEAKNKWSYASTSIRLHGVAINYARRQLYRYQLSHMTYIGLYGWMLI
jgi:hypothetical protein